MNPPHSCLWSSCCFRQPHTRRLERRRRPPADQPNFYTSKAQTNIIVHNGQRALIGVYLLSKPEGYMEVFIVQAFAVPIR